MSTREVPPADGAAPTGGDSGLKAASSRPSTTFQLTEVPETDRGKLLAQYDKEAFAGSKFATDILMYLDARKVMRLRKEFLAKDDGLAMHEFVFVLKNFLRSDVPDEGSAGQLKDMSDTVLVSNLCELFEQIDINGDGTLEWDEFTSFIVETGMHGKENEHQTMNQYHPLPYLDLSKHYAPIEKMTYLSQLDRVVASEQGSNVLKLLSPNCQLKSTVTRDDGFFMAADHIPEMNHIVASSSDLQISFYDDSTLKLHKCFHTPSSQMCVTWSPEAQTLFTAGVSGVVHCWDAQFMEEKYHMGGLSRDGTPLKESHDDIVLDLLMMPSLEILASASMDHTIRLWDMHTGKARKTLTGHTKGVRSLAYSPEYRFLVSAGFDYDALVWNPYVEKLILPLHGHNSSLCGVVMVPGTPQIITGDTEGTFKLWDIRNFGCVQTFSSDDVDQLNAFVCVNKHRRIVSGGKRLHMFDYEKQENPELTDDVTVFAGKFNSASNTFATAAGRDVKVWSAVTGELVRRYRIKTGRDHTGDSDLTAMCLDGRKRKFITGDHDGSVLVFDFINGAQQKKLHQHGGEVTALLYCDRDQTVISASRDLTIVVCDESDPDKGAMLKELKGGHSAEIAALAFSSQLSLIASGCNDGYVCLWDYEFGKLLQMCLGHTSSITCLCFLDPFPLLAVADHNGNIAIWATRPSKLAGNVVCRFVNNDARETGKYRGLAPRPAGPVLAMGLDVQWVTTAPTLDGTTDPAAPAEGSSAGTGAGAGAGAGSSAPARATSPRVKSKPRHAQVCLYTADEKGMVKCWSLSSVVRQLMEHHKLKHLTHPYPALFPRRNLLADVTTQVANMRDSPAFRAYLLGRKRRSPFYTTEGYPLCAAGTVTLAHSWRAHSDAVYSLDVIKTPPSLFTTSFDRLAHVWSLTGKRLGTLQQGGVKMPWQFRVDNSLKIDRMERIAKETLQKVEREIPAEEVARLQNRLAPQLARAAEVAPRHARRGAARPSSAMLRFQQRRAARMMGSAAPLPAVTPAPGRAHADGYYGAFLRRVHVVDESKRPHPPRSGRARRGPGRGRRGRRKGAKQRPGSKPRVPRLDLTRDSGRMSGTPDMTVDVLQDLTDDIEEEPRHVVTAGGPVFLTRARSPIRTTPRLAPITARTAGRGANATHKGYLRRMSKAAWREHRRESGDRPRAAPQTARW